MVLFAFTTILLCSCSSDIKYVAQVANDPTKFVTVQHKKDSFGAYDYSLGDTIYCVKSGHFYTPVNDQTNSTKLIIIVNSYR